MKGSSLYRGFDKIYAANVQLPLSSHPPVLVYQMGKVGSSSIWDSLRKQTEAPVFHLHWFHPWRKRTVDELSIEEPARRRAVVRELAHERRVFESLWPLRKLRILIREKLYYERIYENAIAQPGPVKLVTPVREPASTAMSMFFESFEEYVGTQLDDVAYTPHELADLFNQNYLFSWPLTWFDKEMKPTLGLDVYDYDFPREEGHQVIKEGRYEMLLLKCELSDAAKAEAIGTFMDLDGFEIIRRNKTQDKQYAAQYRAFKDALVIEEETMDRLCDSKYARHFYTLEERETARKRWTTPTPSAA